MDLVDVPSAATALELAAGTGKFTRQLNARFGQVVAVEPDSGMRRVLARACPGVQTMNGSAERIPVAEGSIDALFVAQGAVVDYARATFDEIHEAQFENPQTVVADGLVAYFGSMGWVANLPDRERVPLLQAMRARLQAAGYVLPWQTHVQWTHLRNSP